MGALLETLVREEIFEQREATVGVQLFSYLVVGCGAMLGFVLLSSGAMLLPLGFEKWIVSSVCYALFILPTYFAHRRFTFNSAAPHGRALPVYVGVQLFGIALATGFSWVAYGIAELPTISASLMVIVLTSGANFVVLRQLAFNDSTAAKAKI